MTCRDAEELISLGIDGALTGAERARLDTHLADCAACRTAWEEHHRLARLARQWVSAAGRTPEVGEAFTAEVLARIAARPAPVSARPAFWLPLAAAGLLAAALALLPYAVKTALPNIPNIASLSRDLPGWLLAYGRGLPSDADTLWAAVPSGVLLPHWVWSILLAAGAVNGLCYARAAQARRERSQR